MELNDILNTKDETSSMDAQDIEKNKVYAILSYLAILVLVPIFAAKDSKFARFHAGQGLVLLVAAVVVGVLIGICSLVPVVKIIMGIVGALVELVCLALMVLGIVNAAQGQAKELPLIGKYAFFK